MSPYNTYNFNDNYGSILPDSWLSPRAVLGVNELGPWPDKEGGIACPPDLGYRYFPKSVWDIETSESAVVIPGGLRELYAAWRPTPLREMTTLRSRLKLKSRIFFKDESTSPVISYKANSALAQAWYAREEGLEELVAYTLSGYWGVALAWAANQMGIRSRILVPEAVLPSRRTLLGEIERWGGLIQAVKARPLFDDIGASRSRLAAGCFFNSVVSFNSLIGQEASRQLDCLGLNPDAIVGCCGGGTNFGGLALPFLDKRLSSPEMVPELVTIEPAEARKFGIASKEGVRVLGEFGPVYKTLCLKNGVQSLSSTAPWAPGLAYPVATPLLVSLFDQGLLSNHSCSEQQAKSAAKLFAETEGFYPAPEAAYAVWGALETARALDAAGQPGVVLFCLSGKHWKSSYEEQ